MRCAVDPNAPLQHHRRTANSSYAEVVPERQAVSGRERIWGGEQRSVRGRRAERASKNLTRRVCPSAMSEANAASYAARPRTEQHSGVDAQHRPPQLSVLPGTACRDLAVSSIQANNFLGELSKGAVGLLSAPGVNR